MEAIVLLMFQTLLLQTPPQYMQQQYIIWESHKSQGLGITQITRSKFINLRANATGGAIAVKGDEEKGFAQLLITDCEFTNITAGRNGGAIFADIAADSDTCGEGIVVITNTSFNKNTAEFGGAILQLGGTLALINSTFTNNTASENGGAVYTSRANVVILPGTFTNNRAQKTNGYGGALYLDHGEAIIVNSTFTDNSADNGEAIYCYEIMYTINNVTFKNNTLYTGIRRYHPTGLNFIIQ